MKNIILTTSIFLALCGNIFSQPDTLWTKTYGDIRNDEGLSVIQKNNGGYIICGRKGTDYNPNSYTSGIWIIATDSNGEIITNNTYGGWKAVKIIQTSDDKFMVLGNTFTLLGNYSEDIILLKLDESGDTLWTKAINLPWGDFAREIHQTSDSGYLIVFFSLNNPHGIGVIRTNAFADTIWTKIYGGQTGSLQITEDNGFVLLRYGTVLKADSSGNIEWVKSYSSEIDGRVITKSDNFGYYIVGHTFQVESPNMQNICIMKINSYGDSLWFNSYPFTNYHSYLSSVNKISNGSLIISGSTSPDGFYWEDGLVMKVDSSGILIWQKNIGGAGEDEISEANELNDGSFIAVGSTKSFGAGNWDCWLIKLEPDSPNVIIDYDDIIPSKFSLEQNYPNPFNPSTKIRYSVPYSSKVVIKIYDVLGNEIETLINEEKPAGTYEVEFNASLLSGSVSAKGGYASGVYYYQLKAGSYIGTKKMLLIK